jgi:hypothetical protein
MPKHYAGTFLPWILLAILGGFDVRAGAVTGLVAALVLLGRDLRRGHRADSLILEISTSACLALLVAVKIAGFAVPAVCTARYPDRARKRHLAGPGLPVARAAGPQPSSR